MFFCTDVKIKMESEYKAVEAIKVINKYFSHVDEKHSYVREFVDDLKIENNCIVTEGSSNFTHYLLDLVPGLFKAIAQNDPESKFKATFDYCDDYTEFNCNVIFKKHSLKYNSILFPDGTDYYCPDEDCGEWLANYEELMENETFTCPECGKVYTADELAGERPEITEETLYIE